VPRRLEAAAPLGPQAPRRAYFGKAMGWLETPVLARADLAAPRRGPCIIEEYDATCLILPGATGALDGFGNILIDLPA
jgi:N-methylhydantoinase A